MYESSVCAREILTSVSEIIVIRCHAAFAVSIKQEEGRTGEILVGQDQPGRDCSLSPFLLFSLYNVSSRQRKL
jgi:hypothetical protein